MKLNYFVKLPVLAGRASDMFSLKIDGKRMVKYKKEKKTSRSLLKPSISGTRSSKNILVIDSKMA